jgi:hypothetical protein
MPEENDEGALDAHDLFDGVDPQGDTRSEGGEGQTDAETLCDNPAPCGGCETTCELSAGPETEHPFTPTPENSSSVTTDSNGYLVLDSTKMEFPFIWMGIL